jgi:bifunctional non-homologous end joining protein LigD
MPGNELTIDGHRIELSNLDKVLFPKSGLTKGDLVEYYRRIGATALPYYRDRPLSMHRFPDGIDAEGFFQKDTPDYFPDWIDRATLEKKDGVVRYAVANSTAALVFLADQGCITPHLALARADKPDRPDRLIFDLDPSDEEFDKVRRAARAFKALLDELKLASFVQTTGSRGLHVVVPLSRRADFDEVRRFARDACQYLADRNPTLLTIEQRKNKRGDRVFLDYLRNAYGQTAVGPYAVRAREGAPVATPLDWKEVGDGSLGPQKFNIKNLFRRLGRIEDPWRNMTSSEQALGPARDRLERMTNG